MYTTFTKDGRSRTVSTVDAAVRLRFEGWKEQETSEVPDAPEPPQGDLQPPIPPKNGPGSGAGAWHHYARNFPVDVPADATREQIIELLEAAEIPTEASPD